MTIDRLNDRYALVTGASRGIGRAVAERFAAEGATVAVNHHREAEGAAATLAALHAIDRGAGRSERPHLVVEADVAVQAAVDRMFGEVLGRWPRLDILINNAGIVAETPGDDFAPATFDRVLAVNLAGAAYGARAAIAHFLSRPGGGVIVNTTSVHELIPKPGYSAYAMSKAGLGALTRTLALEFADRGIRVNAVGPGAVTTDMNAAWVGDPVKRAAVERRIPMRRAAQAAEIAPVFAFLASDDAAYITGQTVFACGGLTLFGDFQENWST